MAKKNALAAGGSSDWNRTKGAATIRLNEQETRVRITWEDDKLTCSAKLLPEVPEKIDEEREYYVEARMQDDEVNEIIIRPLQWMGERMKYVDMSREDADTPPAPYEVQPKNEKWSPFLAFSAFLEFQDGEFAGVRVPYWMHYKFEHDGDGYTRWSGNPDNKKATRVRQCVDFFTLHEAVDEPIEWPEDGNVLPELHQRILNAGVAVKTAGRDGYITEMIEAREPELEKVDRGEVEAEVRRKPVKKEDDDFDEDF